MQIVSIISVKWQTNIQHPAFVICFNLDAGAASFLWASTDANSHRRIISDEKIITRKALPSVSAGTSITSFIPKSLEPLAAIARTKTVASELLSKHFVAVDNTLATFNVHFGRVSPRAFDHRLENMAGRRGRIAWHTSLLYGTVHRQDTGSQAEIGTAGGSLIFSPDCGYILGKRLFQGVAQMVTLGETTVTTSVNGLRHGCRL